MALRGETHARAGSTVPSWIYGPQELGHSCGKRELRLDLLLWVP